MTTLRKKRKYKSLRSYVTVRNMREEFNKQRSTSPLWSVQFLVFSRRFGDRSRTIVTSLRLAVYLLKSPESFWNGPNFNFFPIFRTVRYNPYISVQIIITVWLLFTLTAPKEFGIPVLANVSKLTYVVKVSFKPMAGWNRNISNWPCGTTPLFKTADYKVAEEHDYHGQNHCNPHWIRVR